MRSVVPNLLNTRLPLWLVEIQTALNDAGNRLVFVWALLLCVPARWRMATDAANTDTLSVFMFIFLVLLFTFTFSSRGALNVLFSSRGRHPRRNGCENLLGCAPIRKFLGGDWRCVKRET